MSADARSMHPKIDLSGRAIRRPRRRIVEFRKTQRPGRRIDVEFLKAPADYG
jgi:hypothetical protein